MPPTRKPDSLQNFPEIKQRRVFSTFIALLMTKVLIKLLPNTHKHFVTNNIFQVELPRYFFEGYSVIGLQETCSKQARIISNYL